MDILIGIKIIWIMLKLYNYFNLILKTITDMFISWLNSNKMNWLFKT